MKLQVNNSGAWKTVIDFKVEHIDYVLLSADSLGMCEVLKHGNACTFRLIDDGGNVSHHWTSEGRWRRV